jgi:GNAT superfamily N-acetyltransferase
MRIEVVDGGNFPLVLPLIAEYQKFYGVEPNAQLNEGFFRRLLERREEGIQFLALSEDGRPAGFATVYWQLSSLSAGRSCVLNDLYTAPEHRGKGVARALIAHASSYARCCGVKNIEWQTQFCNERAQRLYDRLPAKKSVWYGYALSL